MSDQPGQGRARGRGGRGKRQQQGNPPGQQQEARTGPSPVQPAPAVWGVQQQQTRAQPSPVQQPGPPGGDGASQPVRVGRGRSRGSKQAEATQVAQPGAVVPEPSASGPPVTGGRATHRGAGRETGPSRGAEDNGNQAAGVASQMGQLSLSGRPEYRRREPFEKYIDTKFKEETKVSVGTEGDKVALVANYFRVSLPEGLRIFQYHVDFKPIVENIKVRVGMVMGLDALGEHKLMDGGILYLTHFLPKDPMVLHSVRTFDNMNIEMTFTRKCEVMQSSPQFLQIANLLMKKVQIALGMNQIRDHYFDLRRSIRIDQHHLEVVPGFTTSIHKYDGGNLLGVDIIHKILRTDTFLDGLYRLYHTMEKQGGVDKFQEVAYKNFVGTIVLTRYNNKTYKVDDINWEKKPTDTFEKNGQQMSYIDYYKDNYGITIRDLQQPLLVSRPTERDRRRGEEQNLFLVPEVCTVTGLTDQARSDFRLMADLATHTRIGPPQRVQTLQNFSADINRNADAQRILSKFQVSIDPHVVQLQGRVFKPEELIVANKRSGELTTITYEQKDADWQKNMRNVGLLNPVHMNNNWVLIYPNKSAQVANELAACLRKVGAGMNMRIDDPKRSAELTSDRNENYLQAIRSNLDPSIVMVVIVVGNNKKDRYDAIKKSCCIDNPVPSQVVLHKTIARSQGLMSVATKIAIQLNCKMGGEVWGAKIPASGIMIIGLDTYHDSAHKTQSVGAMVATLNKEATRYYCKTEYHDKKSEIMQNLAVLMTGALKKYHDVNKALPTRVIVYRDGVGDGQLDVVFKSEKEQLEQAFHMAGGSEFKPQLAIIIVKKRINTRIFKPAGGNLTNPMPGTVVDTCITKQEWYDFFLVSQSVRQGTVSPTSYNVIYDSTKFQPNHLQMLTYKLTHLYFNWQGTIRVPAPCQYAHKLAFLQGQSLHREFSAHLSDKLFFL